MATLIDTVTPPTFSLPNPFKTITQKTEIIGDIHRVASGRRRLDFIAAKREWPLKLKFMTLAQRDGLWSRLMAGTTIYLQLPTVATIYACVIEPGSVSEEWETVGGGATAYHIDFTLLEQ